MSDIFDMDVTYMITDLRETLDKEEFEELTEVLKESLGEFLKDIYTLEVSEPLTIGDLLERIKKIVSDRMK